MPPRTGPIRIEKASVPAEYEGLDRQHQRLDAQDHGVHEPDGVDCVKNQTLGGADLA
jgi:hypothetical protein